MNCLQSIVYINRFFQHVSLSIQFSKVRTYTSSLLLPLIRFPGRDQARFTRPGEASTFVRGCKAGQAQRRHSTQQEKIPFSILPSTYHTFGKGQIYETFSIIVPQLYVLSVEKAAYPAKNCYNLSQEGLCQPRQKLSNDDSLIQKGPVPRKEG